MPDSPTRAQLLRLRDILTPDRRAALVQAAEFLDSAAGIELELDGISALGVVENLHAEFFGEADMPFHEAVLLALIAIGMVSEDHAGMIGGMQ